jgi:hypothetical protein
MRKVFITGVALASITSASVSATPSHAATGTNSAVQDNFQTIEQFRAKWNKLLDQAAKARNVQHSCTDGLCVWDWQLRAHVQAKMVESNNGAGQAWYCFLAEPATTWDCYGNTLQKWVWDPTGDTAVASDGPSSAATIVQGDASAPVDTTTASFSVPLVVEDGGFKTTVGLGSSFYNMTIDTGATSGLVQESVAAALLARGEATEIAGGGTSTIADGTTRQQRLISVYSVTLDGHTIHNVMFGVGPDSGGMLFGLLPLAQFGRFTIDARHSQLVFG